jgi:hypothetical protein
MRRRSKPLAVAAGLLCLLCLGCQREYDPDFDTRVPDPAYASGGPVVLYDEGHANVHTADEGYRPLAELLRNDGYVVRVVKERFSASTLEGGSVLVVVLARGANDANDAPAFTEAETASVEGWVRGGGSLLLVTDHWPYGAAAASLAARFGVTLGGFVEDPEHHDRERGESHLVFTREDGLIVDHPVTLGRSDAERVRRVLTFTGQSILGPPEAVPFLTLSATATERPATAPRVEKDGGDVRVHMDYGEPVSAAGRAQGVALEAGKGRVVVLGEAGMLRAQTERGGSRVGMNVPGYDNRQLARNILHWLSRAS